MLEKIFEPYKEYSLLALRVGVGIVFLVHGILKLFGDLNGFVSFLEQTGVPLAGLMAPAVAAIELFGGLAILIGSGTRIASLLLIGVMVMAILTVTLARGFAGGYDFNLALLGGLICLLLAGPGKPALGGDL